MAYGGPIKLITGINLKHEITGTVIANHKDTPAFIEMVQKNKFLEQFIGKKAESPLSLGEDIDVVTGATYSSKGITNAISQGSHAVAKTQFGIDVHEKAKPFIFGFREISILILVGLMLFGVIFNLNKLRWVTLVGGLIFIGFKYNTPISLSNVAGLLMGNFPEIGENLIWYVFLIGIPILTFFMGKNMYCFWLCPFGALQEILAKIGGGNFTCNNKRLHVKATKIRYFLIYIALLGAFLLKSPGFTSFEPFPTLFGLQGLGVQWFILPVVLFTSLFVTRFWCRYFCPIMVLNEVTLKLRGSIKKMNHPLGTTNEKSLFNVLTRNMGKKEVRQ